MKRRSKSGIVNQVERSAESPAKKDSPVEFISTGSIVLNLAASQKGRDGGWARGRINNIVGDSSSGKSLVALEACAWAYYNMLGKKTKHFPEVKNVKIIYNNVEGVMDFPVAEMYGQSFYDAVDWRQIGICQQAGRDIQREIDSLRKGDFLLYVKDSVDATISAEEKARIDKSLKDDKEQDGSYKTEKAKYYSMSFFNDLCDRSKGKDATLMFISQVREKIGLSFGEKYYRTGGKAMDFYSHQVVWLYEIEKLKKTFRSQTRVYGIRSKARFKKNKTAKPFREATFPILFNYGIDDVGAIVEYLYGPKVKKIEWGDEEYPRSDFIDMIEDSDDDYEKLIDMVEEDWADIEEAIEPKRKKRFK